MVVALSARFALQSKWNDKDEFIYETLSKLITIFKEHTFIFITGKKDEGEIDFPKNVHTLLMKPQINNLLRWHLWYGVKLPVVLKKYKADVYIDTEGFCSLKTTLPQCILLADLNFLHQPEAIKKHNLFLQKNFIKKCLKKATGIITVSKFIKKEILKNYITDADKIDVIYPGANENYLPLPVEEREHIKMKFTGGNEYFIYNGEIGLHKNLLNLLKAFSAFKKRQKSSMQLLIAGNPGWHYNEFLQGLQHFKFKDDVKIINTPSIEDLTKITASAYAMIYTVALESIGLAVLQAMRSSVPVITTLAGGLQEICADAALYADPENFKEIAVQMMLLFKDENVRNQLIEKGQLQAEKYRWEITATAFLKAIEKAVAH